MFVCNKAMAKTSTPYFMWMERQADGIHLNKTTADFTTERKRTTMRNCCFNYQSMKLDNKINYNNH